MTASPRLDAMPPLSRGRQEHARRFVAQLFVAGTCLLSLLTPTVGAAAELRIEDGVVVKFAPGAGLVVRDRIVVGKGVVLTSKKDDTIGGQSANLPQVPAAGDWQGVRLEKSTLAFGSIPLSDVSIRYAGANGAAALALRGLGAPLQYLSISDSLVGLRLQERAVPNITGSSFLRSGVGIDADQHSSPVIASSQFVQNDGQAILNRTPTTLIQASGNWWGHASGPRDAVGNPRGQGDAVSSGVNYSNFLAAQPLLNPTIRLAAPKSYLDRSTVALEIACINAVEYRIAENDGFAGVVFQPFPGSRATVDYLLSAGEGRKFISVQFRSAGGNVVSASLSGGVTVDTLPPVVSIANPANGSVITQPISIEASASDASGIGRVEIYLDGQLLVSRTSPPYSFSWDTAASSDGQHQIKAIAYDMAGRHSSQSVEVTLSRVVLPPDTEGPQFGALSLGGSTLAEGMVLARSGNVTFDASDRSGVSRIELLLDGQMVGVASGSGSYSVFLDLGAVANGNHTLGLRATDSLGNTHSVSYGVLVAHAVPNAPTISQPGSSLVTRTSTLAVSGSAQAASTVQLYNNGQPAGASVAAGNDGRFAASLTLAPGENRIQATAADQHGQSPQSAPVTVTLDTSVPVAPGTLLASSLAQGKVRLTWGKPSDPNVTGFDIYRGTSPFAAIGEASRINAAHLAVTTYEDMPPQDGTWFYRVVSVNAAGTPSDPGNQAQAVSDGTAPKAKSLVFQAQGKFDAASGRYGQGRIGVTLTVSEPLQAVPYLAVVPAGGIPLVVDLVKAGDTTYSGSFLIDPTVPSGVANAIFSARDAVGNRGTDIESGATLNIDTEGPSLLGITLNPSAPIKNDQAKAITATFTLSKALKGGSAPEISYLLSGPVRSALPVGGLTAQSATVWRGTFILPADAGLGSPETFSFSYAGVDDLDNQSSKIATINRFQVYQGQLPPSAIPGAFTAKAQPGGKVRLDWQGVSEASAYQIYRQGPAESLLSPLVKVSGISHIDQTPADGRYQYAIASIRMVDGEESISGQSAPVEVVTSATAPGAPQNLALRLTGLGIVAEWQPPLSSTVASYNLYRSGGSSIASLSGLAPLKTGIKQAFALDAAPSATQSAYVVTALDGAGNESSMSNSAYLNASLLPVASLKVEQLGNALPVISWVAPNGNVAGYNVYVGADNARIKLTPSPTAALSFTDSGYTAGERRYAVASVDNQGVEQPRSILLPAVNAEIVSGLPIKRGLMNKLRVQLSNTSAAALDNLRVVIRLPSNREATQFQEHRSEPVSLGANQTLLVPVVVGGYTELPAQPLARIGVEIAPNEGELVRIARDQSIDVIDGSLVVGIATEEFTRGGSGKVRLTVENTSEVDIELLTATANGDSTSTELRFKLLDGDGNVLATQAFKQSLGASVVTLTNGLTVARIPAGASYVSDLFSLNVPGNAPASLRVRLEVDKVRYHSAQDDQVMIAGRGSEKTVSLVDTAYLGEVTEVTPISSFGNQDIVIVGRSIDRAQRMPLPNSRLKLVLNQQGFERVYEVLTDNAGIFSYTFKPTLSDGGSYKVCAVHPEMTDRPEQKAFAISRVTVGPTPARIDVPRNFPFTVPFVAKSGPGTKATNLRLAAEGALPAGVSLQYSPSVNIGEGQSLNIPLTFVADNSAPASGGVSFNVVADEHGSAPIGQVQLNFNLSEAKPYLMSTPSYMEVGLTRGGSQIEAILIENKGQQDALNLRISLTAADGVSSAPAWASIVSQADGSLAVGAKRAIDLSFAPPTNVADGAYNFKLKIEGDNLPAQALNVYVSITQSGKGNVLFKASDIYTATVDKQGHLIPGLAGATVNLQHEDVPSVGREMTTDGQGEAYFQDLPAGRYKYRARAANHQEAAGRFQIKPGLTVNQPVFLDYNLVQVEWNVREITIEDRYEVTLNATYETDVPAAVLAFTPTVVNIPQMNVGDVFYGELVLQNLGLVRADNLTVEVPRDDEFFKYEFLMSIPSSLQPKQRLTIPYRIVSLKSPSSSGTASGGGCSSYLVPVMAKGSYRCANGTTAGCSGGSSFVRVYGGSCGGGVSSWGGNGGFFGGGLGGYGQSTPRNLPGLPPCIKCNDGCCTNRGAGG